MWCKCETNSVYCVIQIHLYEEDTSSSHDRLLPLIIGLLRTVSTFIHLVEITLYELNDLLRLTLS